MLSLVCARLTECPLSYLVPLVEVDCPFERFLTAGRAGEDKREVTVTVEIREVARTTEDAPRSRRSDGFASRRHDRGGAAYPAGLMQQRR